MKRSKWSSSNVSREILAMVARLLRTRCRAMHVALVKATKAPCTRTVARFSTEHNMHLMGTTRSAAGNGWVHQVVKEHRGRR